MYINELTIGVYPWDLADEGVDYILDTVQEKAGCNAVYLIGLMHHEKRPLHDTYYPHNPVRKQYIVEDSRVYWHPDPAQYSANRIKPRLSDRDFLKGTDWLNVLIPAARKRGMRTQVEVSHTPLDKERAEREFPDCIQRDIYGRRLGQELCWNNPDARQYQYSLFTDLASNYDLDTIQTCTVLFNPGRPDLHPLLGLTLGGCFCDHCARKAKEAGLDWELVRRTALYYAEVLAGRNSMEALEDRHLLRRGNSSTIKLLLEHPELYAWLRFRCDSITEHFKGIYNAIKTANAKVEFRFNSCWSVPENIGQQLKDMKPYMDSVRLMEYSEQWGDPERMPRKGQWISNARRELGEDFPLISAVAIRAKATPELIHEGIRIATRSGADGLSLNFWDGATMEQLSAVKTGLELAEVKLRERGEKGYTWGSW